MSTLYEKRGRRYVPVRDTEAYEGLSEGAWLVVVKQGKSIRRLVDVDLAGFLAAAKIAEDAMTRAVSEAGRPKVQGPERGRPMTAKERKGWAAYVAIAGEPKSLWMESLSPADVARAGIEAVERAYRESQGEPKR